jgi:hypothetical protein
MIGRNWIISENERFGQRCKLIYITISTCIYDKYLIRIEANLQTKRLVFVKRGKEGSNPFPVQVSR